MTEFLQWYTSFVDAIFLLRISGDLQLSQVGGYRKMHHSGNGSERAPKNMMIWMLEFARFKIHFI